MTAIISMVTASRNGCKVVRNSSHFKKIPTIRSKSETAVPRSAPKQSTCPPAPILVPSSSTGTQQRAADGQDPVQQGLGSPESDDVYVDAEGDNGNPEADGHPDPDPFVPENPNPVVPENPDPVVPENLDPVVPGNPAQPIVAFHPPPNAAVAPEPFALPRDIRPAPYNLRSSAR